VNYAGNGYFNIDTKSYGILGTPGKISDYVWSGTN
jgi:hypothetical protein